MTENNDWIRKSLVKFAGQRFQFSTYVHPSPEWDHEHCVGCWEKISDVTEAAQRTGYVNDNDEWICANCFAMFKCELEFQS
jgi:hypothetical protein